MKLMQLADRPGAVRRGLAALAVAGLGAALLIGTPQGAQAISPNNDRAIVLGVGADATQRTVSWYSDTDDAQQLVYGPAATFGSGTGTGVTAIDVKPRANVAVTGFAQTYNGKATLTGLAPSTRYAYRVGSEAGGWSAPATFSTGATDFGSGYSADFFGDPQIGSSGQNALDGDGWVQTVEYAQAHDRGVELYLSGGDQIDTGSYTSTVGSSGKNLLEDQWDQFLRPLVRGTGSDLTGDQIPWAATIGNHDVGTKTYMQHLATPNLADDTRYYAAAANKATTSGGNYWFEYRDVLYIDLNSNSYDASSGAQAGDAAHVNYVRNVIDAHGADAQYTVLMYHHSIYSPADHANDTDNTKRRTDFTRVFSDLGVDLVLQGHDHSYSRSYAVRNGARTDTARQLTGGTWGAESSAGAGTPDGTTVLPGPGGVIYVTANSASGSKYYDLTEPTAADYGPDQSESDALKQANGAVVGGHTNHWANAAESQEHTQSYIRVDFAADHLAVTDIRSGDCAATSANAAVQRGNVKWCGKASNTFSGAVTEGSGLDTNANGITNELVTAATPTDQGANTAFNAANPVGSVIDKLIIQQFVAPSSVSVSGTPRVGQTLTATLGGAFTRGTSVSWSWKADGVPFATGPSVTVPADLVGARITVTATGTLGSYAPQSVESAPTARVAGAALSSSLPQIVGKPKAGKRLSVAVGSWTPGATLAVSWLVDGRVVATGPQLEVKRAWAGDKITVQVTGTLAGYESVTRTSAAVKVKGGASRHRHPKH